MRRRVSNTSKTRTAPAASVRASACQRRTPAREGRTGTFPGLAATRDSRCLPLRKVLVYTCPRRPRAFFNVIGPGCEEDVYVKKLFGVFAVIAAAAGALMFWRRQQDDDEFLDEELR